MSSVTNIILSFSVGEDCQEVNNEDVYLLMNPINKWLFERGYGQFGENIDKVAGGNKRLETNVFAAAFNYFREDEFIELLKSLPWNEPENVQVFIQDEDDYKFKVFEIAA